MTRPIFLTRAQQRRQRFLDRCLAVALGIMLAWFAAQGF